MGRPTWTAIDALATATAVSHVQGGGEKVPRSSCSLSSHRYLRADGQRRTAANRPGGSVIAVDRRHRFPSNRRLWRMNDVGEFCWYRRINLASAPQIRPSSKCASGNRAADVDASTRVSR